MTDEKVINFDNVHVFDFIHGIKVSNRVILKELSFQVIGFWKGVGVLITVLRQQAVDIQKKTGWNYPVCFGKAVQIFFGNKPVRF